MSDGVDGKMTKGSELTCVACGCDAGYNRAVVDTLADELVGGLCLGCERTNYGRDLDGIVACDSNCRFCAHDGFLALPKWQLERRSASAREGSVTIGYAVEDQTARLCDGHFDEMARAHTPAMVDMTDGREPYDRL